MSSFTETFGYNRVYGVYSSTGAAEMSTGRPVWLPASAQVIHGHFKPHPSHQITFPNSKRLVWVRDPIERLWSHIGHLLEIGNSHPQYNLLESLYLSNNVNKREEIVTDLIINKRAPSISHMYCQFFSNVPITEFDFIGSVHRYDESMQKLAKLFEAELPHNFVNVRSQPNSNLPSNLAKLKQKMSEEYDIVDNFL